VTSSLLFLLPQFHQWRFRQIILGQMPVTKMAGVYRMQKIYLVTHFRPDLEADSAIKIIGIFDTYETASAWVEKLKAEPGFSEHTAGFSIEPYKLNQCYWNGGFFSPGKEFA
ncbi:MAG: hypothetical protein LUQ11_12735, partial [Methylococcaceae bacterium]|nr:hypothetical protein [Methylococcaceae bacterium]